jgi:hypothetical protein
MAAEREDTAALEPEDDGGVRVEVIPESSEEKPRLHGRPPSGVDVGDDEIGRYGKEVQGRIKKLRFAFHEERRLREQSQRDLTTTNEYAQRLMRENAELRRNVHASEQAVVSQALTRVDAEIEQAKSKNRQALESGVADEIVASNAALARAVAEKERLALLRPTRDEQPPQQQTQPPPQADARTQEWMAKNSWYNKPGEEERSAFAMGVHNSLVARGISAASNPDVYWRTIDERLAAVFPDRNANGSGNDSEEKETTTYRPLAVAGGTRSSGGAATASRTRTIRLSESQVRLAHRLGLTPQQYAEQVELEERQGERARA